MHFIFSLLTHIYGLYERERERERERDWRKIKRSRRRKRSSGIVFGKMRHGIVLFRSF